MTHIQIIGHVMFVHSSSETGNTWRLLPVEEKIQFGQHHIIDTEARNVTTEEPEHHENDIPNNSNFPPTDEEIAGTNILLGHEETINTRDLEVSDEPASEKTSCISGCVLFLQTNVKIKKCLIRLHTEGGVGSSQISVEDIYNQPSPPHSQYDVAVHGRIGPANQ
ncbi:hypothetical protein Ddye_016752 [Dipteronia dyeriana]|uniref:Uncharacterized protein n=1 Tax=Dipteronia dyeriana TaxID=168575 RepID=A0AAD9X0C5_9ROSI|nr:hypothetical protein Ddye_016752 [Dipteronia dyeriana]